MKFPYPIETVPGSEAVATCLQLRRESRSTFTPVILGPATAMECVMQDYTNRTTSVRVILEQSESVNVQSFFNERRLTEEEFLDDDEVEDEIEVPPHEQRLHSHFDFLKKDFYEEVVICKVPTPRCWEVPAYFKSGGWNDSPIAEIHAAVHKYWFDLYGAEVISFGGWSMMEFTVAKPPCDEISALELAWQYYLYCPDSVLQGSGTLQALAQSLVNSDYWHFWWD